MSEKERKEQAVDKDYPLQHVPANARRGLISISCVLIGFTFLHLLWLPEHPWELLSHLTNSYLS